MTKPKFILSILILTSLILVGASCEESKSIKEEEEEESKGGSCDSIELDSTCVDFIGLFWSESYCTEEGHFYSEESSPQPSVGGCHFDRGGESEKIVWSYNYGGRPIIWQSEVDDVLRPSCFYGPNPGEWVPGTAKLKD